MIAAVILAAGAGRRMGGAAKALVTVGPGGPTFLEAVAGTAAAAGVARRVVVAAEPHRAAVEAEAARLGLEVAINPEPALGMARSVEVGFQHAVAHFSECAAALLWPVDHPAVRTDTVRLLLARAHPSAAVVPTSGGRGGHPALAGRRLWDELCRCSSLADGARGVVGARRAGVLRVPVEDPGVVADVDRPGDLGGLAE